ncbi:kinase-like domain-containing protein [Thelephora terrestris]|uniref:Kinase-like domain-containing protein n=1 Tax=Thelephora terrestris TaxID=56493 RepID=A0A9P6LAH1_9AGAM|nr:kinase-like domain-containing protein [Thelephora terrestris]
MSLAQRLYDLDASSPDKLDELLHDKEYVGQLQGLPEQEIFQVVDHLNEILVLLDRSSGSSRKRLQVLRKICSSRKILPTNYDLSKDLLVPSGPPKPEGGFCDAFEGSIGGVKVCVKRLKRTVECDHEKLKELFCKEAVVWKYLNHPNIVPFKGVTFDPPQLISEWMPCGELRHHVRSNPDTDFSSLLLGIARGLVYLHSKGVVHGDLKGQNIMIDESGTARIIDFGLAKIVRGSHSSQSTSRGHGQTVRWTAPELLQNDMMVTKESDVHSFAMVVIEVFTGEVPFKEAKSSEVVMRIIDGERPGRPSHPNFTAALWELTQKCWSRAAEERPKMEDVVGDLIDNKSDILPTSSGRLSRPVTSVNDGENSPSAFLIDDNNHGSGFSPLLPTRYGASPHGTTHTFTGEKLESQLPGRRSDLDNNSGVDGGSGKMENQGSKRSDADEGSTAGVPPSGLSGHSLPPDRNKKHGLWCKARSVLSGLKRF